MSSDYFELISGERGGAWGAAARGALAVLSVPYGLATAARNRLYDRGILEEVRVSAPVISLGNLTTGGTGKTPVTAWLAEWMIASGERPAIVSRGYRADASGKNDEALVLEQLCPGAAQIRNRDRAAGAQEAIQQGATAILLDDGYQHRRLARDLNVLLIDGVNPWGYGRLLPRGLLREGLRGVRRADAVLLTRADLVSAGEKSAIARLLKEEGYPGEVVEIAFEASHLVNASGERLALEEGGKKKCYAFCGIGNPSGFWRSLSPWWGEVSGEMRREFADHHAYPEEDLKEVEEVLVRRGAEIAVTTLKDLVKIQRDRIGEVPLYCVSIAPKVIGGEEEWERVLDRCREILQGFRREGDSTQRG